MSEEETNAPFRATAWIYPTLIHGVLALTVCTRLMTGGLRYRQYYARFNMLLPDATEAFLTLSARMRADFLLVAAALAVALVIDGWILWMLGGWNRFEGQLWFFMVLIVLFLIWGVMEAYFFLPYYILHREGFALMRVP